MLNLRKFGVVLAAAAIFATSTFADHRPRNESWRDERNRGQYEDGRHDRQNISAQGRVTALHREGDGYRLQLDRGRNWYYVPSHAWRNRDRGLRIGISVRLGGGYYDSRGWVHCSSADWIDDGHGYRDGNGYGFDFVNGIVRRIDYDRDVLQLRDERTGRWITVDMRRTERRGRDRGGVDLNDLRRGDYVELEGEWIRGGLFRAYRIDTVDSLRW